MSSITLRNLPEGVKENLALRARKTGESLEGFVRRILQVEAAKELAEDSWATWFDNWRAGFAEAPPLKPGEKDVWELTEEVLKGGQKITDT